MALHSASFGQSRKITFQSLEEGLSHHHVKGIVKDSEGFMWFGTYDGLNKYDGTNFVLYENNPDDSTSLCHNSVNTILEDSQKNIWVGTSNGLVVYNRDTDNFSSLKELGKRNIFYVSSLYCDRNDILWIGTSGSGLFRYDLKRHKLDSCLYDKNKPGSIRSNFINSIVSDKDNNVWIGTRKGLELFDARTKSFTHFVHDPSDQTSLSGNAVSSLTNDKDGSVWVGTYGNGLNRMVRSGGSYTFMRFQKTNLAGSLSHNNILSLIADKKGNLWVGTENGGLNCLPYKSDRFVSYLTEDGNPTSISSNSIWSLYEDNIGIVWIGTYNKGLSRIDEKYDKFEVLQRNSASPRTLVNNNVKGFAEGEPGKLWIATDGGGVCHFNTRTGQFSLPVNNATLSRKEVMTIVYDTRKNIWVGTWAGGIDRLNKDGIKIKNYSSLNVPGFTSNNIMCLYEDRQGNIWAGTSGNGLFMYNTVLDTFIPVFDSANKTHLTQTAYVNDILEDSDHTLWVGTMFGLVRINRNSDADYSFHEFSYRPNSTSISSFRVSVIFEDSKKNLWIGTEEGLNLFNKRDTSFQVYQKREGLPNNSIKGILEDHAGNLWISTNKGISKFNPQKNTFRNFSTDDGLTTNEFNMRSCLRTRSGEFFFGGNNGINAFYPDSIKVNTYIPPVYLTDLKIFNAPVKIGGADSPLAKNITETTHITLTHEQSSFTIDFVALNYTRSSKNQYAFMLEGFEKQWNYVGTKRMATYTNLDAGTYIFKVKGSNNEGLWNETPTTLQITVLSPFWKTWWAYLMYVLIFSGVLFVFIKLLVIRAKQAQQLKLEQISHEKDEQLNKLKIQFFTNISHELRTPLSLILSPLEQIISTEQVQTDLRSRLKNIFNNVERLFRLVNELMDFSKSEENKLKITAQMGDVVKFVQEEFYLFTDEAHRRQIEYRFAGPSEKINAWFDPGKLEKIILNLIANAFKFTPDQGKINVIVEKIETGKRDAYGEIQYAVRLSVVDNGSGISPEYIDNVFDRFFQSYEDKAKYQTGTGIGLALVKNLVELHQGTITVTSDKWKETRFTVTFPLGNAHFNENEIINEPIDIRSSMAKTRYLPTHRRPQVAVRKPSHNAPVILIVEDNIELRDYIVSILSGAYQILEAPDGEAGFDLAAEQIPDLIISDIIMPRLNGIEFCKKIKEEITTSHIPVVLLTAKVTMENTIEGIESGADVYITKPFNVNYLEVTIKKLIETRRMLFQRFSQEVFLLPKEISTNPLDQKFLERAIEYIDKNIENEEINVENMASHLAMNRSNLYRKIKALTGQTATEFIRTVRLKMAIKHMESGEMNISEIAFKVGFSSPGYFAKCFKIQFGRTPSEYLSDRTNKVQEAKLRAANGDVEGA